MNNSIISLLLIQIILIALNAVFASAELAVLSVNESKINRLAERGSKKARRLRKLLKEPAKFLSTIQIAINFCLRFKSPLRCQAFWAAHLRLTVFRIRLLIGLSA